MHIFIGYVSVQSGVPERYSSFATLLVKSDYPREHINEKEEEKEGKKEKAFQFYEIPAENWELRVEQLRELHGMLKIYLRAAVVNISTAELQMTKEFLESRPPVPPRLEEGCWREISPTSVLLLKVSKYLLGISLWMYFLLCGYLLSQAHSQIKLLAFPPIFIASVSLSKLHVLPPYLYLMLIGWNVEATPHLPMLKWEGLMKARLCHLDCLPAPGASKSHIAASKGFK